MSADSDDVTSGDPSCLADVIETLTGSATPAVSVLFSFCLVDIDEDISGSECEHFAEDIAVAMFVVEADEFAAAFIWSESVAVVAVVDNDDVDVFVAETTQPDCRARLPQWLQTSGPAPSNWHLIHWQVMPNFLEKEKRQRKKTPIIQRDHNIQKRQSCPYARICLSKTKIVKTYVNHCKDRTKFDFVLLQPLKCR